MMKISALLALVATAAAHVNLETVNFDDHVSKHGLTFAEGSEEWKMREGLFNAELKRVRLHNAAGK